jgi:hypothetical protein
MTELLDRSPGNEKRHYQGKIQPIVFCMNWDLNLAFANAIKYLNRWTRKNGIEDLKKASWYLDVIETMYTPVSHSVGSISLEEYVADQSVPKMEAIVVEWLLDYWMFGHNMFLEKAKATMNELLSVKGQQ